MLKSRTAVLVLAISLAAMVAIALSLFRPPAASARVDSWPIAATYELTTLDRVAGAQTTTRHEFEGEGWNSWRDEVVESRTTAGNGKVSRPANLDDVEGTVKEFRPDGTEAVSGSGASNYGAAETQQSAPGQVFNPNAYFNLGRTELGNGELAMTPKVEPQFIGELAKSLNLAPEQLVTLATSESWDCPPDPTSCPDGIGTVERTTVFEENTSVPIYVQERENDTVVATLRVTRLQPASQP